MSIFQDIGADIEAVFTDITGIAQGITQDLLSINTAMANAAPSIEAVIADIGIALGYAQTLVSAGLLPSASVKVINTAQGVVNAIVANPPSSIASAIGALAAVKTNIQSVSSVPGAASAIVVMAPIPATSVSAAVPASVVTVPAGLPVAVPAVPVTAPPAGSN